MYTAGGGGGQGGESNSMAPKKFESVQPGLRLE